VVSLFTNFALETSVVFLALFASEIGASKLQIGIIGGSYGIAYAFSSWLFGRQSDIKGRLIFVRLGLGLAVPAIAAQALVSSPSALILVRALMGFCLGASAAAIMAYNYESGGRTGRFASLGSAGWLLAAVVAVFLQNYQALFYLSAASCAAAFVTSLSLKEPENRHHRAPVTLTIVRRNLPVYLPFFLRQLGANMIWVILPLFLVSIGASKAWVAVLSGVNTGVQVIAMMFVDRFRAPRLFVVGLLLSLVVFVAYALATSYLQIIPIHILLAIAWSCLYIGALLLLLRNNEEKATATGLLFSTINISAAVGPVLGGLAVQFWDYDSLMYIAAGTSLLGLGVTLAGNRTHLKSPNK
jgi:MFS family permease